MAQFEMLYLHGEGHWVVSLPDRLSWSSQWGVMVTCPKSGRVWQGVASFLPYLVMSLMGFGLTQPYQFFCLVAEFLLKLAQWVKCK